MACFLVPMTEAIVLTVVQKSMAHKENLKRSLPVGVEANIGVQENKPSWSSKLSWLNKMLWGGSLLLAVEHIWHGEVVPWPPFLTAMTIPGETGPMLHEMATFGTSMAVFITAVWFIIALIADHKTKKAATLSRPQE